MADIFVLFYIAEQGVGEAVSLVMVITSHLQFSVPRVHTPLQTTYIKERNPYVIQLFFAAPKLDRYQG